jgi:DNA-directed RNA polymerase subunit D
MNLTLKQTDEHKSIFEINDASVAYVNTLRRLCMKHVPTMAIDTIEVHENDSGLFDEILAHRLGLIALNTEPGTFNMAEPDAEKSAATHAEFTLDVQGPLTVRAEHLEPENETVAPVHEDSVIVELLEDQSISLIATARLGTGDEHSKYDPCLASYYYKPRITVDNSVDNLNDKLDELPPQIVEDGQIQKDLINTPELIDACEDVNDAVTIEYDDNTTDFIFTIEPWGQLTSEQIISEALRVYNDQLDEFNNLLEEQP